jgi:hypothetical protein
VSATSAAALPSASEASLRDTRLEIIEAKPIRGRCALFVVMERNETNTVECCSGGKMSQQRNKDIASGLFHADKSGFLMPSHLMTPISDVMKSEGLVEDCVCVIFGNEVAWQKLTQRGSELRKSLFGESA